MTLRVTLRVNVYWQRGSVEDGRGIDSDVHDGGSALASIERLCSWWSSGLVAESALTRFRVFITSLMINPIKLTFTFARSPSCMEASLTSPITVTLNALGLIGTPP